MKQKKFLFWGILFLWLLFAEKTNIQMIYGANPEETEEKDYTEEILDGMELEEVQEAVDELMGEESLDILEIIKRLLSGELSMESADIREMIQKSLFAALYEQKNTFLQIFLLVLTCAVLKNFAEAFAGTQIGEISFYVVYLIMFVLLLHSFSGWSTILKNRLESMVLFMKGLTPAYFLAISASTGTTSAALFYQLVLVVIYGIQWVLEKGVLPAIHLYVLMELVNRLSREEFLTKLTELVQIVIGWTLKTLLGIVIGMQVIQGMVGPVLDQLKRTTVGKAAASIPGIGNIVGGVTQVMITSAVVIRNCMGVTFLLILLLWGMTPLIQYAVTGFFYKVLSALCQPIADNRMVECLNTMGEGCFLLMKTMMTAQVLCMISFLILTSTFGGG